MSRQDTLSIGCELQPVVISSVQNFKRDQLISHLQVTIPNTLTYFQAKEAASDIPIIAHCNLLNTFGENSWSELRPWVRQIRALNPVHVVEHFTSFRHPSGEKSGIAFDVEMTKGMRFRKIVDTVRRWQDLLGTPLCLENVPIARDVEAYFNFLLEVRACNKITFQTLNWIYLLCLTGAMV